MADSQFAGKTVVVTGGTGSFGSTMVRHLLTSGVHEVRVFSRDELKQDVLRRELNDARVQFILGDTRDPESMRHLFTGVDHVFHAAALKQVPSGDFFPLEVTKTNVFGSANVIHAAESAGVRSLVVLSTDKAVYPINAMGISKALMEKVAISEARRIGDRGMKIAVTRYGNVMMSRGSVIPFFLKQAQETGEVTITDPSMTRFMMSLQESVGLVEYAMFAGNQGSSFVRKAPAATIGTLVEAIEILTQKTLARVNVGIRHGEKIHETLLSAEEKQVSVDQGEFIEVPMDSRTLDYSKFFEKGDVSFSGRFEALTSENATQLEAKQLSAIIEALPEYRGVVN